MEMGASVAQGPIEQVTITSLRAGLDICMICHSEDLIWRAYEAVLREAEQDRRFAAKVAASCDRVLALKAKTKSLKKMAPAPSAALVEALRNQVHAFRTKIVGEMPL